jgi:hypothetical protein
MKFGNAVVNLSIEFLVANSAEVNRCAERFARYERLGSGGCFKASNLTVGNRKQQIAMTWSVGFAPA